MGWQKHTHAQACAYRVIDSPHQDAQHRVTGTENLHVLLNKVFLFRLSLGRQSAQSGGDVGRRHGALGSVCAALRGVSVVLLCKAAGSELLSCSRCSRLLPWTHSSRCRETFWYVFDLTCCHFRYIF